MPLNERVRAVIPDEVGRRLADVEGAIGRPVDFAVDPALGGLAHGVSRLDGTIGLSQAVADEVLPEGAIVSPATLGVIGEEVMHSWRRAEGFPQIEPQQTAWDDDYYYPLLGLGGFFDEHSFFPFLEGLRLDPRSLLTPLVERYEVAVPQLSVLFVQLSLMAPPSEARTRVLRLFQEPVLAPYATLGGALINEIEAAAAENAVCGRPARVLAAARLSGGHA